MYNFPILKQLEKEAACTPDFITLNRSDNREFLIFVYDNLMEDMKNSHILNDSVYYGRASTNTFDYVLRETKTDAVAFQYKNYRDKDLNPVSRVFCGALHGQLYGVSLRTIADIDFMKMNGNVHDRRELWVGPHDPPNRSFHALKVFCWLGREEYWGNNMEMKGKTDICLDCVINGVEGFYYETDPRTEAEYRKDYDAYVEEQQTKSYGYYGNMY